MRLSTFSCPPSFRSAVLAYASLSHSLLSDINWQEAEFSVYGQPFYKGPVIALIIHQWIQHLSALKTWLAALEQKHTITHTHILPSLFQVFALVTCAHTHRQTLHLTFE